jgi:hypothetical protein
MKISTLGVVKVAVVAAVLGTGCLKSEEFPIEPRLTFKRFDLFGDSASVVVSFTDGDGDVGLNASDLQPPFDTGSVYYNNLFLEYYEMRNGEWVRPTLLLPYNYRIPRITPTGQNKALEGDIAVAIKPWPIAPPQFDTVRFSVRMYDRALHESNTVFTDPAKLP